MSRVTTDIISKNRAEVGRFAFLYEFKFHIKFVDRTIFISSYKNHVMKITDEEIITHSDCRTNTFLLEDLLLVEATDFTTMKILVDELITEKFNKKKMQFSFFLLSDKPKLETCKYVFVLKDFASRKLQELRDKAKK